MQLILNSDTDIGIQRKMSAIEQESFKENFINSSFPDKTGSENCDINTDSVKENVVECIDENEDREPNGDMKEEDKNSLNEISDDIISINQTENNGDSKSPISNHENDDNSSDLVTEEKELEEIKSDISVEIEQNDENQIDLQVRDDKQLNVEQDKELNVEQETNTEVQVNVGNEKNTEQHSEEKHDTGEQPESEGNQECTEELESKEKLDSEQNEEVLTNTNLQDNKQELETNLQESSNDKAHTQIIVTDTESDTSKEISTDIAENENIIDIQDEKDDENVSINDQEMTDVEIQSEILAKIESDNVVENTESLVKDDNSLEKTVSTPKEISLCSNEDTAKNTDKCLENEQSKMDIVDNKLSNNKESKKSSLICKLSNTLDILSDEEEEPAQEESQKELSSEEKQCINMDDDDDIILVDEETNSKDNENAAQTKVEDIKCQEASTNSTNVDHIQEKETLDDNKDSPQITEKEPDTPQEENKSVENKPTQKPLLPVSFLKSCKKNLADMTRDELEEFCILKIVESVVDRSNLSEIKAQINIMTEKIEEYKKKTMIISKQNRDLQLVLKSVQEEQKKKSDVPITPLKITRSVGMQVFMTDKIAVRRKSTLIGNAGQNNLNPNITPNRLNKSLSNQSPKTQKSQTNGNSNQQIPVPRLVPANITNNNKIQPPSPNIAPKVLPTSNLPNGMRNSPPAQKPEKRPHSKMQQGNSFTVDLTDDEPPSKIIQRNVNPPVRLVSPQNLLAPQRQPFGSSMSSPRKVYIPISGSQSQVRPGQTIMLKSVPPPGPRQRLNPILPKPNSNTNSVRVTRITNRHPAPLPDCIKQYQPPNWKELPPAPELKLSKVENGIVISWKIDGYQEDRHEEIASYQLYAYQETTSPPSTQLWKKIGDVKALPLPMACTLTQFMAGYKYYFAVRAVDIRSRLGPFSAPGSILLLNKM